MFNLIIGVADLAPVRIHFVWLSDIFHHMSLLLRKKRMLHVDVLFARKRAIVKKVVMNVFVATLAFAQLLVLNAITWLKYFEACLGWKSHYLINYSLIVFQTLLPTCSVLFTSLEIYLYFNGMATLCHIVLLICK